MRMIRLSTSVFVLTLMGSIGVKANIARAQATDSANQFTTMTYFHLDYDGKLKSGNVVLSKALVNNGSSWSRFVKNETVRLEMNLGKEKWERLERKVQEIEKELETLRKGATNYQETIRKNGMEQQQRIESLSNEIKSSLNPKQQERLLQLEQRFQMREQGISRMLFQGELVKQLEISAGQFQPILETSQQIGKRLSQKSAELKQKALQELSGKLSSRTRQRLEDFLDEKFFEPENTNFGILIWQLRQLPKPVDSQKLAGKKYSGLDSASSFTLDVDGSFIPAPRPSAESNSQRVYLELLKIMQHRAVARSLELVEEQKSQVQRAVQEYRDSSDKSDREFQSGIESGEGNKIVRQRLQQAKEQQLQKVVEEFETVLLPHQKELLESLTEKIGVCRSGLFIQLLHGSLGIQLEITEAEKSAVLKAAPGIADMLSQESLKLEAEMYAELSEVLTDTQKQQLEKMIGEPPKHGYANIDLLSLQLTMQ